MSEAAKASKTAYLKITAAQYLLSVGLLLLVPILYGCAQAPSDKGSENVVQVAASFYPLAELAKSVGGDKVKVSNLTPAGAEPHDFEPSPRDVAAIESADMFIFNGAGFDPWATKVANDLQSSNVVVLDLSRTVQLARTNKDGSVQAPADKGGSGPADGRIDPHYWLDPVEAQGMVKGLTTALTQLDPKNKDVYLKNQRSVTARLKALDESYKSGLSNCANDLVVSSHASPGYLARRYGFGVLPISGIDPESEPSPKDLAGIAEIVTKEGLKFVFFESLVSPKFAQTVARETGAETLVFDPIEGVSSEQAKRGIDYFSLMEQNLNSLATALECSGQAGAKL